MGRRPPRYAVLLTSAALSTGLLLTGCGDDPKPSPPPTEEGTVAAGDPTTPPPTSSADAPTSADPTGTATATKSPTTTQAAPSHTTKKNSGDGSAEEAGAPGVPQAARQHTNAGAKAFVRHYNKLLNTAWAKPKAGLLAPLSLDECKTCAGYEAQARKAVHTGEHLDGPGSFIKSIEITPGKNNNVVEATVREAIQARKVLDADGDVVGRVQSDTAFSVSEIRWTRDGWRMQSVKALQ